MRFTPVVIILLSLIFSTWTHAQKVSNVRAELQGENVRITYNLEGAAQDELYDISVYSSHNNFREPLEYVSGDVGKRIRPGTDHEITWRAREELDNYRGEIVFEIRASLMGGYYTITNPSSSSSFKPGKDMLINWTGGSSGENVRIDLIRFNSRITTIAQNVSNQGSYGWIIPKSIEAGKGYQVQITNTADAEQHGTSKTFKIKKFPVMIAVIGGAVVLGAIVAVLLLSDDGGDDGTTNGGTDGTDETLEDLPPPIEPESILLDWK